MRDRGSLGLVMVLAAAVMLIDGFDLQVMALVVPQLAQLWGRAPADFGIVLSAPMIGLGIGAALVAPMGDRYGRRPVILTAIALIGLAVASTPFATGLGGLSLCRALTGLGLGTVLPNISALMAELIPARNRAGLLTLIGTGIPLGAMGSGLLVPILLTRFGWEAAFWGSAAVTVPLWLLLLLYMPESPRWTEGRREAFDAAERVEHPFRTVMGADLRRPTILLWILFTSTAVSLYMLTGWVPTLLTQRGWAIGDAAHAIAFMQGGGLVGGLVIAVLMDRWHPLATLVTTYGIGALSLALFSLVPPTPLLWSILFGLIGAATTGVYLTLNAIAAAIYPPRILSSGIGFTVAIVRVGAITGPLTGAWLIGRGISAEGFFALLIVPMLICGACAAALPIRRTARGHRDLPEIRSP